MNVKNQLPSLPSSAARPQPKVRSLMQEIDPLPATRRPQVFAMLEHLQASKLLDAHTVNLMKSLILEESHVDPAVFAPKLNAGGIGKLARALSNIDPRDCSASERTAREVLLRWCRKDEPGRTAGAFLDY